MNRRGVTIIEVLMCVVIGSIAVLAMWPPFVAERVFWNKGKRQTEAQRDAQMALRAMAFAGRESHTLAIDPIPKGTRLRLEGNGLHCFDGTPTAQSGNGRLIYKPPPCSDAPGVPLIDGVRSRLVSFSVTRVVPSSDRLVRILLTVSHRLRTTDSRQEEELLETTLFLRNG